MGAGASKGQAGFSAADYATIKKKFATLSHGADRVSIEQLQQLPEYATNPFVARMFELFDTDGDGVVTLDEFAAAIKTFSGQARCTGAAGKTPGLAFRVFDLDEDGYIGINDLFLMLRFLMGNQLGEVQLAKVVKATMEKYDGDGDGQLTEEEFGALLSPAELLHKLSLIF